MKTIVGVSVILMMKRRRRRSQTDWNAAVPQSFAASDHPVVCLASTDH